LFWTGNASVRREDLLAAGMFDTAFDTRWGMEDVDLGYRLYKNNLLFELNRSATSIHYPHPSDPEAKRAEELHNKRYFHQKHNTPESKALLASDTVGLNLLLLSERSRLNGALIPG
jgi:GT2 family glycosyltransferase